MTTIAAGTPSTRPRPTDDERTAVRAHLFGPPARDAAERLEERSREMQLSALGWCTASALVSHARRRGWELGEITVEMSRVDDGHEPRIGRLVQLGHPLDEAQREELARVCENTPVTRAVAQRARISTLVLVPPVEHEHWFAELDGPLGA